MVSSADNFATWFIENQSKVINHIKGGALAYDEDALQDTFIKIFEMLQRRKTAIRDPLGYFLTCYRSVCLDKIKKRKLETIPVDEAPQVYNRADVANDEAADFREINADMLEWVRGRYSEKKVSIFEMYTGMYPDVSYRKLSKLVGLGYARIGAIIGEIVRDLNANFQYDKDR